MSTIEKDPVKYDLNIFNDDKVIHLWRTDIHALCGATQVNHGNECKVFGSWPEVFKTQDSCPTCKKPICPFCQLLNF